MYKIQQENFRTLCKEKNEETAMKLKILDNS